MQNSSFSLFDLHCDTITQCLDTGKELLENDLQLDLKRGAKLDNWIQVFAFWLDTKYSGEAAFERFLKQRECLLDEIAENPDLIELYGSKNPMPHKCRALMAIEGGHVLGGKLQNIKRIKGLGVSFLTLVWNCDNELASGVLGSDKGLSEFGKEAVFELEKNNIIIDISHLNQKGADELFALATKPVIATHSNSRAINDHKRNLYDYQFEYLIEHKGLCGINFYPEFINNKKDCTQDDFKRHFDHMLTLGCENILALGSDFDGAPMPTFMGDFSGLYSLYENVVKWYGNIIADKIFYQNAKNFLDENVKE